MKRVLEIGPGTVDGKSTVFPEADTIDLLNNEATYNVQWGQGSLPIADDQYDHILASHVLEHVPWYRVEDALTEVYRVLKPKGVFEVYVPNFAYLVTCYQQKKCGDTWRVFNKASDWMTWVNGRLFSYGEDATELISAVRPIPQTMHKTVFDADFLKNHLRKAGFKHINILSKRVSGRSHGPIELGAWAVK